MGPNNSGKSNVLRAAAMAISNAPSGLQPEIVEEILFSGPDSIKARFSFCIQIVTDK